MSFNSFYLYANIQGISTVATNNVTHGEIP